MRTSANIPSETLAAVFFALTLSLAGFWSHKVEAQTATPLRLQVAKAIQSDEKGLGYFTTEEGLTALLVATLGATDEQAKKVAREILEDRKGSRYYYFTPGGPDTLAGRLKGVGAKE